MAARVSKLQTSGGQHEEIEDLVRAIVDRATADKPGQSMPLTAYADAEEIVLDLSVDGSRYLLLRMPEIERAHVQFSPRELEIARMVALGHPNKVIADVLSISTWTVCTHLRRMFAKMGVGSRAAMVARLVENRAFKQESCFHRGGASPHR